jgi:RNA polymerase sigma factor (sigma-70 family)
MTDSDLLRKFVDDRDEDAFAQIVDRHIDMVYAAANRQLAGSSHADDVTQAVFIVLAKKAVKVNGITLAGWLVNAARLLAKQSIREEARRKQREQQAAIMKAEYYKPEEWQRVGPIVDEALSRLGPKDRTAVTLRYLEGREIGEVAASMGVSEAAAAKRLTRALSKLRRLFARRGVEIASLSIGESLLRHARAPAPSGLAGSSVAAAMGKGVSVAIGASAAAGGASAATALADAAIGSAMFAGSAAWTYSLAAVVVASLTLGGYGTVRHIHNRNAAAMAAQAQLMSQNQGPPPTAIIRVGILLSQFTAEGPHYTQPPYGYKDGYLQLFRALRTESNLEVVPIIEPGSEKDADLAAILKSGFRGKTPIDGSRKEQLMTLDVIACPRVWNETPVVLNAIRAAVRDGKGLLVMAGFALHTPGIGTPPVDELNGLKEGLWEYCSDGADCQIAQPHPLLGNLKPGDEISLPANGECGILADGATGLVEVSNLDDVHEVAIFREIPSTYRFFPVIVGRLGKGRIVNCQFTSWEPVRDDLQIPTGGRFIVRCVEWLADHQLN